MATETLTRETAEDTAMLAGRLCEMSHRTSMMALDALLSAVSVDGGRSAPGRAETALVSKALADRMVRSLNEVQSAVAE
ncbi:hypothetical protein [Inquilinus sp. CAU 1745]|uniref:hypothetical protein n=1 Tax=Inquilinus sp. CAU 1745 TaxID=3140369 RepID=UPI00325C0DD4